MISALVNVPDLWRLITLLLLIAAVSLATGIALTVVFLRYRRRLVMRSRQKQGAKGEVDAALFLKNQGYTGVASQCRGSMRMTVDGAASDATVRADFIAYYRGRKCVVEVKTGGKAPDPCFTDTRRQMLEYAAAYGVDQVHLFDAEAQQMHIVEFPTLVRNRASVWNIAAGVVAGLAIGVVLVVLFVYW